MEISGVYKRTFPVTGGHFQVTFTDTFVQSELQWDSTRSAAWSTWTCADVSGIVSYVRTLLCLLQQPNTAEASRAEMSYLKKKNVLRVLLRNMHKELFAKHIVPFRFEKNTQTKTNNSCDVIGKKHEEAVCAGRPIVCGGFRCPEDNKFRQSS